MQAMTALFPGRIQQSLALACMVVMGAPFAAGQVLSLDFEVLKVPASASWTTVALENSYASPVVACTYNIPSALSPSATTRIRMVTSTSFEVRLQQFENSSAVTPGDVHCLIADEGAYNAGGLKFEARKVFSDQTSGLSVPNGWGLTNIEEITDSVTQSYSAPVVLGQVMSFNDVKASVFWTNNCVTRGAAPFASTGRACVGKHIGQINSTRAGETLGYFVVETGGGLVNGMRFAAALGADSVAGIGNAPPYTYSVGNDWDVGMLTQAGEDGGQGGWAVLYGTDPLPANTLNLGIEEETVAGDTTRKHTNEQVGYWVFRDEQVADLVIDKTVDLATDNATPYAIPGQDIIYSLSAENIGNKTIDADSIFIVDEIPQEVTLYYGDIDGSGPLTDFFIFTANNSGLTFNPATDLGFSNLAAKPADFSACSHAPTAGYDASIRWVCVNPKGRFKSGAFGPSDFSFDFRAGIK